MTNLNYLYNPNAAKDICDKNHFVDKKLHFKIIERGTILPHKHIYVNGKWTWGFGGIVDNRNEFIENSFVNANVGAAYSPTEPVQYSSATVVYLGLFYPVWGHVITDNIRRLWFLKNDVFKSYFKDCPLVYVPFGGVCFPEHHQNFRRLQEILELEPERFQPILHPVQFENIILPDESFFGEKDMLFTNEYRAMIEDVKIFALKNRTPTSSNKIYFYYGTGQIGEERLAQYFRSKGYEIISPELLTFDEQLNLLINAESFASTLGSCAHNSLFLREGTEAIFIPRAANRFTDYQSAINRISNLNVTYIDSTLSILETFNGPYCFIISRQLKNFFGEEFNGYSDDDLKIFLEYVKFYMSKGFQINKDAEKYYGEVLQDFLFQLSHRKDLTDVYGVKFD